MDLPKLTEQVKLNMKSIQEILIKNRLLEEKVNYLELQIEEKFTALRNHLDVKLLVELDECRHRHAQLMAQFLSVITQIESF